MTYLTWTADNLLRHTGYVGLREDKPATEVRRETAGGSGQGPGGRTETSPWAGEHAYRGRVGKDRSACQGRHSIASTSPPLRDYLAVSRNRKSRFTPGRRLGERRQPIGHSQSLVLRAGESVKSVRRIGI